MTRSAQTSFDLWLVKNGAEPLDLKQNEFARFRANGILCIIYAPNRKGHQSCVPELAQQAFDAWCARKLLDLSNEPEVGVEDRRAMYTALKAVADRIKGGEDIDVDVEAAEIGISARRLVVSLSGQGAIIPEFA